MSNSKVDPGDHEKVRARWAWQACASPPSAPRPGDKP
jgi:hypothetical protein